MLYFVLNALHDYTGLCTVELHSCASLKIVTDGVGKIVFNMHARIYRDVMDCIHYLQFTF